MSERIVIGSRGSELALRQSEQIAHALRARAPDTDVVIEIIRTTGDKITDVPLAQIGGKGLFTKEIEEALLAGAIDLAVHSMKDLPTELPPGLCLGAVPKRENPRDVLVSSAGLTLDQLPPGARVGTSSLRRAAQLRAFRGDLALLPLRGNVNTRLRKVSEGGVDAAILAAAGLSRLGLSHQITQEIPETIMLPAPAQGALAIETRQDDAEILRRLAPLDDPETRRAVAAERTFLAAMQGGCQVPLGALATRSGESILLDACVCSLDGARILRCRTSSRHDRPEDAGNQAAAELRARGAGALLESLR
ncbi:MAG TPA: hydroxymethylbilane synthase [Candidatus Hydrogenedentes bacterium]|jgi:hydroxymethylbilane synthase|nr:hydroxymethylbilane synthase [Candidatus Hydrogenedentota bacterium]MDY0031508.1 hydroxymethylbilane synthase [FCB group bacterium]HNZ19920.1 hydroxymethylbilane synthase [Candidatus Hydrogenedentota bacterium]HOH35414.1 hydroxymethylbilane synthase [Candidatus Hydrogenedentota bacterium]HPV38175.1 hydroxymethylbilane synthase [Candidatus Hydrogenedentota bacterium]